jgi:hypothetical protein
MRWLELRRTEFIPFGAAERNEFRATKRRRQFLGRTEFIPFVGGRAE